MKKGLQTLISILSVGTLSAGIIGGALSNNKKAFAEDNPIAFSSSIRAVTPYDNQTINFNTK